MKRTQHVFCLLVLALSSYSQSANSGTLSGLIVDETDVPVEFATPALVANPPVWGKF